MKKLLLILIALSLLAIPSFASACPGAKVGKAQVKVTAGKCLEINKATAKQLQTLKGVGAAIAKAIVDYRKAKRTAATKNKKKTWNFNNWKSVMAVKGVSKSICSTNIGKVCFSGKLQKTCPK